MKIKISNEYYLAVVPILLSGVMGYMNLGYFIDDGLIYARYIQNFSNGHGLVYNPGEVFNGLTSPMFTYISILVNKLVRDPILSLNYVSMFFHLALVVIIFRWSAWGVFWRIVLSLLLASSPYILRLYGMETSLYLFLIAVSLLLFEKDNTLFLGIALSALILTRQEGVFMGLAMLAMHLYSKRDMPPLSHFLVPALMFIAHFGFNILHYGHALPDSSSAKLLHGQSGYWSGGLSFIPYFYIILDKYGLLFWTLPFAAFGLVQSTRLSEYTLVLFLVLLSCFYIVFKIPHYQWYYAPMVLAYYYFSVLGLAGFSEKYLQRRKPLIVAAAAIGLIVATIIPIKSDLRFKNDHVYQDIGKWLKENVASDSKLATVEIGMLGYFSGLYVIDILGLIDRTNAKHVANRDLDGWMDDFDADLILVHDPLWELEESAHSALSRGFSVHASFNFEGYTLLEKVSDTD